MEFVLTQHARARLIERGIRPTWVGRVLQSPEREEPDPVDPALRHFLGRIPEFEDRVLRVIANIEADPVRVVTAFFDRRRDVL